jgi:hypothetical protein
MAACFGDGQWSQAGCHDAQRWSGSGSWGCRRSFWLDGSGGWQLAWDWFGMRGNGWWGLCGDGSWDRVGSALQTDFDRRDVWADQLFDQAE